MTNDQRQQFLDRVHALASIIGTLTDELALSQQTSERQQRLQAQARRVLREHDPVAVSVARQRARGVRLAGGDSGEVVAAYLEHLEKDGA